MSKETIIASKVDGYKIDREVNVTYMSRPVTSEDGVLLEVQPPPATDSSKD